MNEGVFGADINKKLEDIKEARILMGIPSYNNNNARTIGHVVRAFILPSEVRPDKANTEMKDGILEVRILKMEEAKKKEIKIKVG